MLNSIAALYGTGVAASTTAYESIATVTVGSGGASSVTFNSFSGYTHLQIRCLVKGSGVAYPTLGFNGDTGGNYSTHNLFGNGSTASADHDFNQSTGTNTFILSSSQFSAGVIDILDYANTNKNKTVRTLGGYDANGSGRIDFNSGAWYNTSAITSITLSGSTFAQYSSFALYGVK